MSLCVGVGWCVCRCGYVCTWKPEINLKCLSQSFTTPRQETKTSFLTEPAAGLAGPEYQ